MARNIKLIFILLFEILSISLVAQSPKDSIFVNYQTLPKFKGEENGKEFRNFIGNTLIFPESAMNEIFEGKVYAQFRIDSLGNVTDVKIIKGFRTDLDQAVLNALKLSPKWTPATLNNRPISITMMYPVTFKNDRHSIREMKREKRNKQKTK